MNKQETIKIISVIKMAYPKFFVSDNPDEVRLQVEVWQDIFSADPYRLIEESVKALICTLKYPPTIADVKEKLALITQPQVFTEMEAWGKVLSALKNANYHAQEEFYNLPSTIQKIVGSPNQLREWAMMDGDTVNSVIQSNFMRSYTAKVKKEKEFAALPESVKGLMGQITNGFSMDKKSLESGKSKV